MRLTSAKFEKYEGKSNHLSAVADLGVEARRDDTGIS